MFVRNGQVLGSVNVAELKATAEAPEPAEPQAEPEPVVEPAAEEVERPKDYALKPAWVDYAVAKGAVRDEAEELSKTELIEQYG